MKNDLNSYSEIASVEKNNNGILVTFKSNRSYLVKSNGEISKQNNITISGLVVKNGDTDVLDGSKSVPLNTPLTINFTAGISEGSIISISPTLPYTTNGTETSKTFTITGTDGVTKQYTVNLKGYYNIPELQVGDFINYTLKAPTTDELSKLNSDISSYSGTTDNTEKTAVGTTLLCRVLEIDSNGNPTKLISADGVNSLSLYGANGYNNAVYLINEMCKTLYSGNLGTTRSLTIEDLENNYFSDAAITVRNEYTSTGEVQYGQTKYYLSNSQYPNIALEEAKMGIVTALDNGKNIIRTGGIGLSQQTNTYIGSGNANASTVPSTNKGITVTQTYYYLDNLTNKYKNNRLYNIFHQKSIENESNVSEITRYWMASRCVSTNYKNCSFHVRYVSSNCVNDVDLFNSYGTPNSNTRGVRPIITLNSGIDVEYGRAYNDIYNLWNLK